MAFRIQWICPEPFMQVLPDLKVYSARKTSFKKTRSNQPPKVGCCGPWNLVVVVVVVFHPEPKEKVRHFMFRQKGDQKDEWEGRRACLLPWHTRDTKTRIATFPLIPTFRVKKFTWNPLEPRRNPANQLTWQIIIRL